MQEYIKLITNVPTAAEKRVLQALAESGAGALGNYDSGASSHKIVGRFRALDGANPQKGKLWEVETVEEIRIETTLPKELLPKVLKALHAAHPYEIPIVEIHPIKLEFSDKFLFFHYS